MRQADIRPATKIAPRVLPHVAQASPRTWLMLIVGKMAHEVYVSEFPEAPKLFCDFVDRARRQDFPGHPNFGRALAPAPLGPPTTTRRHITRDTEHDARWPAMGGTTLAREISARGLLPYLRLVSGT